MSRPERRRELQAQREREQEREEARRYELETSSISSLIDGANTMEDVRYVLRRICDKLDIDIYGV